ncbi:MAG: FtsX-like permease family protein [Actinomycetota bacterium]|nr:FtsX-like permease family protein [Actinomycetota bacterium]
MRPLFVLRWAARDLRKRWLQVAAIALVIAIGTGVYAALGSTATWRRQSNDESFRLTGMYDLRVRALEGADAPQGAMLAVLQALPDPSVAVVAEERLVVATQVDASTGDTSILVPGKLVGLDVSDGGPQLTQAFVAEDRGRTLRAADDGAAVAVLERNFAQFYDLPATGTVAISGDQQVQYVGQGLAPEYFFITTDDGGFFAQANLAVLFVPLTTAQELAGDPGRVNDLVLQLRPDVAGSPEVVRQVAQQLADAFDASGLQLGVTVMTRADEPAYQLLYDDIEGDQKVWNVFAALILAGAAFGAFNLSNRMVEAQRREIGIAMALGASRRQLAVRPMLVGAQIAVLGVLLGMGVGALAIAALRPVYTEVLPMPVWHTDLQMSTFVGGAVLGFVLPLLATAWPVLRAVRMAPVDAITTTHRSARGGLSVLLRHLPWPRSAFRRMPLGNVLRTPRRTLLTALGIGAAVSTLVAIMGMLDSFLGTIDTNEREVLADHPDRVAVALDGFVLVGGGELIAIQSSPAVGAVEPVLRVGGSLIADNGTEFDVLIEAIDMNSEVWSPTLVRGDPAVAAGDGIVISQSAADDLGLQVGDTVTMQHPARDGLGFTTVRTTVQVAGVHPSPFRFNVYLDRSQLATFGAEGIANQLYVLPAAGHTPADVQRALFGQPGVASVQPVATAGKVLRDTMASYTSVFRVLQGFIVFLALLIAYNATSINADERARERATLFAFGLPVRRVLALEVVEGLLYGVLGTAIGVGVGTLLVRWVTTSVIASTMPDMTLETIVSPTTLLTSVVLGVLAVAVAPLLTLRRLRRMDVPGTLRVVE